MMPPAGDSARHDAGAGRQLLSEGATYALVDVAQQALAMVAVPIFFFFLTVADFGLITEAIVLLQIALTLSTLGLDFSVMRLFYQWSEAERRRAIAGITVLSAIWSLVLAAGLHAVLLRLRLSPSVYWTWSLGWWGGLVLGIRGVPLSIVRVTGALRAYTVFVIGGAVLQVALQITLVIAGFGPAGYMLGYAAGALLSTAIAMVAVRGQYAWSADAVRLPAGTVAYTLRILPSTLFSRLIAVSDRILLAHWATQETLGVYGAASRFTTPLKFLSGGFKMALVPMLSREERSGNAARVFRRISQLIVLGMLLIGTSVAAAVWFIQFTPWSAASRDLLRLVGLLLLAQYLSGLAYLGQLHLYYSPRPGGASIVAGVNAAVLFGALGVLVPRGGAEGAALAAVSAAAAAFAAVVVVSAWQTGRLQPWLHLLLLLVSFLPCVGAAWVLGRGAQLIVIAITLAAYGWGVWLLLRGFQRADRGELYGL